MGVVTLGLIDVGGALGFGVCLGQGRGGVGRGSFWLIHLGIVLGCHLYYRFQKRGSIKVQNRI